MPWSSDVTGRHLQPVGSDFTEGVKMTRSNLLKFRLEIGVVNLAKFTRDISCLAGDEFLVISEGYHMLIYIFVVFFLLLGAVLYYTSWCRIFPVVN